MMGYEAMRAGKAHRKRGVVLFLLTALACAALLLLALCPAALAVGEPSEEDLQELKGMVESLGNVAGFYHVEVRDDAVFATYAEGYDPQSAPVNIGEEGPADINELMIDSYRDLYNVLVVIKLPGGTYTSGVWSFGAFGPDGGAGWGGSEGNGLRPGTSGEGGKGSSVEEVVGDYMSNMSNFDMVEEIPVPGEGVVSGGGRKIPGPGSWWQWLTGTVVAGAIATGLSLVNLLFPPSPPPPLVTEPAWPEPPLPEIADGTVDPFAPPPEPPPPLSDAEKEKLARLGGTPESLESDARILEGLHESFLSRFAELISNDIRDGWEWTKDTTKWVLEEGSNPENLIDASQKLDHSIKGVDKWQEKKGEEAAKFLHESMRDPSKPLKAMDKGLKGAAKLAAEGLVIPMLKDPWGTLKAILGVDLWVKAMDPNRPIQERLAYSALATLNTISLIEGAVAAKTLVAGGAGKGAAVSLVDDGVGAAAKGTGDDIVKGVGGLADEVAEEVVTKTVPKRRMIRPKGFGAKGTGLLDDVPKVKVQKKGYELLDKSQRAKMPAAWGGAQKQAESKVDDLVKALESRNPKVRRNGVLGVQGDDLAKLSLDSKDPKLIQAFNQELKKIQSEALEKTRLEIAKIYDVDPHRVSVFKAKNPSNRIKVSMDDDITVRVLKADGPVDVNPKTLQKVYDKQFYEAAGRPKGVTPKQLGEVCRNKAVDSKSAEAYVDYKKVQKGLVTRDPTAVGKTISYKADEEFALADKLFKEGKVQAGMKKRLVGMRETGKQFNNQIRSRARIIRGQVKPGSEKWKWLDSKLGDVEDTVSKMNKMVAQRKSPVEIDAFLRSKGTTAEDLSKRVGEIYEEMTIWAKQ